MAATGCCRPLQGKPLETTGQLGTWAALLGKPSKHTRSHLSWQMLCQLVLQSPGKAQAQAGIVQPVTDLMMEQAVQAPVVVLVHCRLCICLTVREWDPLDLQRDRGWRSDLPCVAHSDLSRRTCGSHNTLSPTALQPITGKGWDPMHNMQGGQQRKSGHSWGNTDVRNAPPSGGSRRPRWRAVHQAAAPAASP